MHSDPLANYERQLYSDYEAYLLRSAQSKKSPSKVFRLFKFFTLYILLSGSIFTVLVGALNFSAYSARVVHWINPESIIAITKDIQSVISTSSIEIHASEEESESRLESREIIEEKIKNTDPSLLFSRSYEAERLLDNIPKGGLATPKFEITPYENRIIIPKLGKNIPLLDVYHDLDANYIEMHKIFMEELRKGVVRYPGTAQPGEKGNVFIFGHSSNYPWVKSEYNDVFALLDTLENGDEVTIFYNQRKFTYKITDRAIVKPGDMKALESRDQNKKEIAIMTCWPIGTTLERIILFGELVEDDGTVQKKTGTGADITQTGSTSVASTGSGTSTVDAASGSIQK